MCGPLLEKRWLLLKFSYPKKTFPKSITSKNSNLQPQKISNKPTKGRGKHGNQLETIGRNGIQRERTEKKRFNKSSNPKPAKQLKTKSRKPT
jgi:hypothetical protein